MRHDRTLPGDADIVERWGVWLTIGAGIVLVVMAWGMVHVG